MISGKNYIGERLSANGNIEFNTFNPQTNKATEWTFIEAGSDEINEACDLAYEAFKIYRNIPAENRAQFLDAIAKEIEQLGEELIEVYCIESGLGAARARVERTRTLFQLRSYAEFLRQGNWQETSFEPAQPDRAPNPKPDLRKTMVPLGPVAVFGASNFPLAYSTAGGDTASALAAGCPVIVKSHPMHAGTGELVASAIIKAAQRANMPNGIFSNLNSKGIEVGTAIVMHPSIKAVGFTGSIRGGRALFDLAATRPEPIPVFAEMGSINPVIISEKMLSEQSNEWAEKYANSITTGTGQFCTNPGLILAIESDALHNFANELSSLVSQKESTCMLHPSIKNAFSDLKKKALAQEDVMSLTVPAKLGNENYADQTVVMVSGDSFEKNHQLHQEVFGPFSMIVACTDMQQLIRIVENIEGQLTGTIVAKKEELETHKDVVEALLYRVGRIIYNGVPTGVEVCAAMNHGGPYPASTDSRFTAVGIHSIKRWIRPITYQNFPVELLPEELK